MCDGRPLWDIDENGVRMDYAYDPARQLVETTRSAVMDGETVITPETITTYTLDAVSYTHLDGYKRQGQGMTDSSR